MSNQLQMLQRKVASLRHRNPSKSLTLIVVAGSGGKTTTATLLNGILTEAKKKSVILPEKYYRSVHTLYGGLVRVKKQRYDVVIIELRDGLLHTGVFADISIDCLVVSSEEKYIKELLACNPKHLVVPTETTIPDGLVEPYQHITVGEDIAADARIESMQLYRKGTEVKLVIDHQTNLEVATQLVGYTNAENLATAIAAAYVLGVDVSVMQEGVADIEPLEGRFERIETEKGTDCYLDSGGSVSALDDAVRSALQLAKRRCIVAIDDETVTSDMIESVARQVDRVIVADFEGVVPTGVESVENGKIAVEKALRGAHQNDLVLFYGHRFAAEKDDTITLKTYLETKE